MELLTERGLATLNDGSATRYDRREVQGATGKSVPDVTVAGVEESERLEWTVVEFLSSDHLPILVEWKTGVRVNRKIRAVELNLKKGDWRRYRQLMEERIGAVLEEENMDWKLKKLTRIMKETAAEVCPVKVLRKEVIPWMTSEIRNLRRRRNRARRDLRRRRGEWVALCGELKDRTAEAKRATWRRHLDKIREEKNMSRAWSVVKQLRDRQSSHGGAMMY